MEKRIEVFNLSSFPFRQLPVRLLREGTLLSVEDTKNIMI